jgi:hypothetical protein
MKYDVFLSHASEDKNAFAQPLSQKLLALNLNVWFDKISIDPGESIHDSIIDGIKQSKITVLILSESFLKKNWTNFELGISDFIKNEQNQKIIPIYYNISSKDVADKMPFLGDIKGLDAGIGLDNICQEIIKVLNKSNAKNAGYKNLNELDLIDIAKFFFRIRDRKVNILATHIEKFSKISQFDYDMAIIRSRIIAEMILNILAPSEKKNKNFQTRLKNIPNTNHNIIEHFRLINRFGEIILQDKETELFSTLNNLELCKLSLTSILNWFYNTYFSEIPLYERKLMILEPNEITYTDVIDTFEIENKVLRSDLISPVDEVWSWYLFNNYSMHCIKDSINGKVAGFINALPVVDEFYDKISTGKMIDTIVGIQNLRKYDMPDFYKVYVSSICISPEYQNTYAFKLLYDSFIDLLLNLALKKEIFISEILADASTFQGERLCNSVGMIFHKDTDHNSKIYKGVLIPPSLRLRNLKGKELINVYQRKFEEFREFFQKL